MARIVRFGYQAAQTLDRYLRVRARHAQAWRPQLCLATNNRGPLTPSGIYHHPPRLPGQAWRSTRTGSGIISATPGWAGAARRAT